MRLDNALFLLIGGSIAVSQAIAQRETVTPLDPLNIASAGHRVSSAPIRPWEKPTGNSQAGVTHISTEGLVGYWPFYGNAHDESENGNEGTVFGGAELTEDRFNNPNSAYFFDGVDDYIGVGDSEILEMTNYMSMMAWIKPHFIYTSILGIVLSKVGEYQFARDVTNEIFYSIYNSNPGGSWIPTGYQAPPDEWTHIAIVYDGGLATTYVNGTPFFIYSGSGSIVDVAPDFNVLIFGGRYHLYFEEPFHGVIDDIRIYNRALYAEEVLDIYNEIPDDPRAQFGTCYGSTGSSEPTYPGSLITIDPLTGTGTFVGPTGIVGEEGPSVPALAIKSTGEMYALSAESSSDLFRVNASTGAATLVASTGLSYPDALAFDSNDALYAVANSNNLYTLDGTTGTAMLIGPTGFATKALACDPIDGTMYGCSATDEIYAVDLTTGASTFVGITGLGGMPYTLISKDSFTARRGVQRHPTRSFPLTNSPVEGQPSVLLASRR